MRNGDPVAWVARHVLPHEPALRRWLRGAFPAHDVDDVVQESYCRLAAARDLERIEDPRRYLFQTARNVALADLRRARVVRIDSVGSTADMEAVLSIEPDRLSPDRVLGARWLLARVDTLLATLPERARTAIRLRKIDGLSQREIAARLGVTETVVENDVSRGCALYGGAVRWRACRTADETGPPWPRVKPPPRSMPPPPNGSRGWTGRPPMRACAPRWTNGGGGSAPPRRAAARAGGLAGDRAGRARTL